MYYLTFQLQSLLFQVASLIDFAFSLPQEVAMDLAQTSAGCSSQSRTVSLSPADCGLPQLMLGFCLLIVNHICNYLKLKSVGQQLRHFTTFKGFQSLFVLIYMPLTVLFVK